MNKEFFNDEFKKAVAADGWEILDSGYTRDVNLNGTCLVLASKKEIAEVLKISAEEKPAKHAESTFAGTPPKSLMVNSRDGGGYTDTSSRISSGHAASLINIPLPDDLTELRSDTSRLTIRCEAFWVGSSHNIVSYNFSCIVDDFITTVIFFPYTDIVSSLSIDYLLGRFLDFIMPSERKNSSSVTLYQYIPNLTPSGKPKVCSSTKRAFAYNNAAFCFDSKTNAPTAVSKDIAGKSSDFKLIKTVCDYKNNDCIPITLLLNFGLNFFSLINTESAYSSNLLKYHENIITELNHGIFTSQSFNHYFNSYDKVNGWNKRYLLNIDIRDAVCLNCCGNDNSIPEIYGKYCDCYQADFSVKGFGDNFKRLLDKYLAAFPRKYLLYAQLVNTNILLFESRIWGVNKMMPCTVTSAACKFAQHFIQNDMGCLSLADFYSKYSGFKESTRKDKSNPNFYMRSSVRLPISDDAETVHRFCSFSYSGGYNACFSVDVHHGHKTFDVDICSAYPTAMCLVPAIDYDNPFNRILNENYILSLDDFIIGDEINPMTPMVAFVTYRFPESTIYPCLRRNSLNDDNAPCFPLEENDPVYCTGPELYAALKMGAEIKVVKGFILNTLKNDRDETVYPYRNIVVMLVRARCEAAKKYGKNSLPAKLFKFVINSLYGKIAQNVHDMYSPNKTKANNSESLITNNFSASLITSFIRSVLFAAFTDIHNSGYHVYSATTDGLITDMPFEKFDKLPLLGFRDCLTTSRCIITEESHPKVWEVKHSQDDLLNFTTRGNASLIVEDPDIGILGGVIARNGASSTFPDKPKESYENRKAFIENVVSRTGRIQSSRNNYTSLEAVINTVCPYTISTTYSMLSMDFDMKRKPIESTIKAEYYEIDGHSYEVATFETQPYKDKEEYLLYKRVAERQECLRTVNDMRRFFCDIKCEQKNISYGPREDDDYLFKKLMSCIMAYRAGEIDIPHLDTPGLTVKEKVAWIQENNPSKSHVFNAKAWDKTSEKKRQAKRYPYEVIKDIHEMLLAACPAITPKVDENIESIAVEDIPPVSSVPTPTVKAKPEKPEKFLEVDGRKMYFDDENEELLNESLNSPYYDNPYMNYDFDYSPTQEDDSDDISDFVNKDNFKVEDYSEFEDDFDY